ELTLADGAVHSHDGSIRTIERAVNASTGTLTLQLSFPNPDKVLRPGQYGRARLLVETRHNALLVPQRAVQELQNLRSVAVAGADNKVAFRNVTVGPRVDSLWVVEQGLSPGDHVVAEGLQALRDGLEVRTNPLPPAGATPEAPPVDPAK